MNEARAWAALGNAERTRAAIERAENAWDGVRRDDLDELGGICTFSRPRQLYYAAHARPGGGLRITVDFPPTRSAQ
jgi:hypothetical protein